MWRSLSSPQIHQKYIYMWNNSYRTPTERWQKTQTSQKARNSPRTWVGQKKKEKTETKEQGWDLHHWEGAVKGEKFPHTRKPLRGRRLRVAEGGSFGATEESAATGGQRAKWRDSRTEDRCRLSFRKRGKLILTEKGNTSHDEMEKKIHTDDLSCHILRLDIQCIKEIHA